MVGGPGTVTDHDREPLMLAHIKAAYNHSKRMRFD